MQYRLSIIGVLAGTLVFGVAFAQPPARAQEGSREQASGNVGTLATVSIPRAVKANGETLNPGTYTVRLTGKSVEQVAGGTAEQEQWVEFVQNGQVKGREVATVVPAEHAKEVGKGPLPPAGRARVELLKGNDYLRVWINKGGASYLIHLPTTS